MGLEINSKIWNYILRSFYHDLPTELRFKVDGMTYNNKNLKLGLEIND